MTLLIGSDFLPARIKTEIWVSEKSEVRALGGYDVHALPGPHPLVYGSNARLVDVHNPLDFLRSWRQRPKQVDFSGLKGV